jgi:hypothetical protein
VPCPLAFYDLRFGACVSITTQRECVARMRHTPTQVQSQEITTRISLCCAEVETKITSLKCWPLRDLIAPLFVRVPTYGLAGSSKDVVPGVADTLFLHRPDVPLLYKELRILGEFGH